MVKSSSLKNILLMQYPVILKAVMTLIITEKVKYFEKFSFADYLRHVLKVNEVS